MPTDFEQTESGLIVPITPPEPEKAPRPPRGPLELQNDEQRAVAKKALSDLWDAMGLSHPPMFKLRDTPSEETYAIREKLWELIAEMLLGDDAPVKEVYC